MTLTDPIDQPEVQQSYERGSRFKDTADPIYNPINPNSQVIEERVSCQEMIRQE